MLDVYKTRFLDRLEDERTSIEGRLGNTLRTEQDEAIQKFMVNVKLLSKEIGDTDDSYSRMKELLEFMSLKLKPIERDLDHKEQPNQRGSEMQEDNGSTFGTAIFEYGEGIQSRSSIMKGIKLGDDGVNEKETHSANATLHMRNTESRYESAVMSKALSEKPQRIANGGPEAKRELLRRRKNEASKGNAKDVMTSHRELQDEIAGDLVDMARVLKGNSELLGEQLLRDKKIVGNAGDKIARNLAQLRSEGGRLEKRRGSSWWTTWYMLITVASVTVVFFVMVLLLRVTRRE